MERNTVTTLNMLVEGDRFYKHSDKKKAVFVVLSIRHSKYNKGQISEIVIAPPGQNTESILAKIVKSHVIIPVVFLRHEINVA